MKNIILASKSPRRLELLTMIGFCPKVIVSDIDESSVTADSPKELVKKLSYLKAEAVLSQVGNASLPIIAADTVVETDGKILGKPASAEDAYDMLSSLSGKLHYVHTGFTVIKDGRVMTEVSSASVKFRELEPNEIQSYVDSREPFDKAGAYGIQGPAGAFVEEISGDFYAIVGLPICRISTILKGI